VEASKKTVALQLGNILAFTITLAVNGLANTTLIGGRTTADISNMYPTLVTPAGYVFAIWGVIYALLFIFIVYQALPAQRNSSFHQRISGLFILSCALNVAWLFLWQNNYVTYSIILILGFLITLEEIERRLRKDKEATMKEKAFVRLPFSVYFGWVTVATFANIAAAFSQAGWVKWVPADASVGIGFLAVLLAVVLAVVVARRDVAVGLVAVWALVGVAVNQSAVPGIVATAYAGAAIAAIAVVAVALWSWRKTSRKPPP
jgi:translocator protein